MVYQQKKAQRVVTQRVQNQLPLAVDSSNETGTRVDVTTKLAIATVTSAATTAPSLLPSPPPPQL